MQVPSVKVASTMVKNRAAMISGSFLLRWPLRSLHSLESGESGVFFNVNLADLKRGSLRELSIVQ